MVTATFYPHLSSRLYHKLQSEIVVACDCAKQTDSDRPDLHLPGGIPSRRRRHSQILRPHARIFSAGFRLEMYLITFSRREP